MGERCTGVRSRGAGGAVAPPMFMERVTPPAIVLVIDTVTLLQLKILVAEVVYFALIV